MNELLAALTTYARRHGYPAAGAYLPAQKHTDGTLTIRLLAGRYGKIKIENSAAIGDGRLRRMARSLKEGAPIEGKRLETTLYNIAALGGIEAAGLLSPGEAFGTSDLTIRVRDGKRQSYVLYSENHGSETSGRYRYGLQGTFENLTKSGDRLSLGLTLSNKDMHNYSLSYSHPIGGNGTVLGLGISRMDYELSGPSAASARKAPPTPSASLARRPSIARRKAPSPSPTAGTIEGSKTNTSGSAWNSKSTAAPSALASKAKNAMAAPR